MSLFLARAWGPFVLADRATLEVASFPLPVFRSVPIAVMGIHRISEPGLWRALQFASEALAVTAVTAMGGWAAAPVVAVALRLVLDPFNYTYYPAGLVFAALAFDLLVWRRTMPVLTVVASLVLVSESKFVMSPHTRGAIRLAAYGATFAVALISVVRARGP